MEQSLASFAERIADTEQEAADQARQRWEQWQTVLSHNARMLQAQQQELVKQGEVHGARGGGHRRSYQAGNVAEPESPIAGRREELRGHGDEPGRRHPFAQHAAGRVRIRQRAASSWSRSSSQGRAA